MPFKNGTQQPSSPGYLHKLTETVTKIPMIRAVVRAWAAWAQAHVLKWLIAEKMQKMGYFHCIFLIWPTSCEKPNDGPGFNLIAVNANKSIHFLKK